MKWLTNIVGAFVALIYRPVLRIAVAIEEFRYSKQRRKSGIVQDQDEAQIMREHFRDDTHLFI